jgi:transcriptional regulator with XRE-family HTH domain
VSDDERARPKRRLTQDEERLRHEIGERIALARANAGYSNASAFARRVGVDRNTLQRWEKGENAPDALNLAAIVATCNVSADWILRGQVAPAAREVLEAWYQTKRGESAPAEARSFLESLPIGGYTASFLFYDIALTAFEHGLSPEAAAAAARVTTTARTG